MRIAGTNIPNEKRIVIALTYIFGVGLTTSKKILVQIGMDENKRVKDLTQEDEDKLRALIEKTLKIEGDLRREITSNIKRLKDVKCYRGVRHMKHLPSRGQRTKVNSRTVRGNTRKTAGSGKAKSAQKT